MAVKHDYAAGRQIAAHVFPDSASVSTDFTEQSAYAPCTEREPRKEALKKRSLIVEFHAAEMRIFLAPQKSHDEHFFPALRKACGKTGTHLRGKSEQICGGAVFPVFD